MDHKDVPDKPGASNPFLKRIHTRLQIHVPADDLFVGDASAGGESTDSTPGSSTASSIERRSVKEESSSVKVSVSEPSFGEGVADQSADGDTRPELRVGHGGDSSFEGPRDEGRRARDVHMPDGTLLFTVEAGASADRFRVLWPNESRSFDLCKDPVAEKHVEQFMGMAEHLASAAWWRAMLCDEMPFQGFSGVLMLPGVLTPIIQATLGKGLLGGFIDTVQAVGFSHLGLVLTYLEQDRLRGKYGGANPGKVVNPQEDAAARESIQWQLGAVAARAEVLADMKTQLTNGHHYLLGRQRELKPNPQGNKQALSTLKAKIKVYEQALDEVNEARAACVREKKALLREFRTVEGVAAAVGRTWTQAMSSSLCQNRAQFAARLVSYSLPFIIYSNLYIRYITQPLRPVEINETTGETQDLPFGMVWLPFIVASSFYGFVIQQPYQIRNLGIGDKLEYGMQVAGAYGRRGYSALLNALACGRRRAVETGEYDEETAEGRDYDEETAEAQMSSAETPDSSERPPSMTPAKAKPSDPAPVVDVANLLLPDEE